MKSKFQTYNTKKQHLNIKKDNFPLLLKYLDTLDTSSYHDKPFESTDAGIQEVVTRVVNDIFNRPYQKIVLPYTEFKPLADEFAKGIKLTGGEPNYIPVVIRSNGYVISISHE
jgi:hypothetical protein